MTHRAQRTTSHDKTRAIMDILEILTAARAEGRDLDEVIRGLEKVVARRLLKELQG